MKKTVATILIILLALTAVTASNISGYVGVSTGYEFNIVKSAINRADGNPIENRNINFQGIPFYLEGETYFCPWVGIYYGVGIITFPTILEVGEETSKPFNEDAPTLYTSPYLGLALRYDFTDLLAMTLDTGLSYTAWKIPLKEDLKQADIIHMLNIKCDLALAIHPLHNMSVRVGLKVDTPVYTGFKHEAEQTGIRVGNTSAKITGAKIVPYLGLGYAYGRSANK